MRKEIIDLLIQNGETRLARISEILDITDYHAYYHLEKLVDEGLAISEKRNRGRYYKIQEPLRSLEMSDIDELLRPLIEKIAENTALGQSECDDSCTLANNVREILSRYVSYLETIFSEWSMEEDGLSYFAPNREF